MTFLDDSGVSRSRDVKREVDVFGNPDGWIQENAQKRKRLSGVYILYYKCVLWMKETCF